MLFFLFHRFLLVCLQLIIVLVMVSKKENKLFYCKIVFFMFITYQCVFLQVYIITYLCNINWICAVFPQYISSQVVAPTMQGECKMRYECDKITINSLSYPIGRVFSNRLSVKKIIKIVKSKVYDDWPFFKAACINHFAIYEQTDKRSSAGKRFNRSVINKILQ